jgi:hypothetical protein
LAPHLQCSHTHKGHGHKHEARDIDLYKVH